MVHLATGLVVYDCPLCENKSSFIAPSPCLSSSFYGVACRTACLLYLEDVFCSPTQDILDKAVSVNAKGLQTFAKGGNCRGKAASVATLQGLRRVLPFVWEGTHVPSGDFHSICIDSVSIGVVSAIVPGLLGAMVPALSR